jgi:hypothetical protein
MLPSASSLANYGGAKNDYSAPRDSTTDRSALGTNPAYADVAAMTHVAPRAFVRFQPNGSSAPTLPASNAHDEHWNANASNAAPVVARSSTGVYTVTYPSIVFDEIPASSPGSTPAGITLNLRCAMRPNLQLGSTTNYDAQASVTSPNVVTVKIFTVGTSTLVDPNDATIVNVVVI